MMEKLMTRTEGSTKQFPPPLSCYTPNATGTMTKTPIRSFYQGGGATKVGIEASRASHLRAIMSQDEAGTMTKTPIRSFYQGGGATKVGIEASRASHLRAIMSQDEAGTMIITPLPAFYR